MDLAQAIQDLNERFPGRAVLYPKDLAPMFGGSSRAIYQLIARQNLPFPVKKFGSRWCVDIIAFAEWRVATAPSVSTVAVKTEAPQRQPDSKVTCPL